MVELTAVGRRDSNGVQVVSDGQLIPYLGQWVRDYVDKRSVTDGMQVLIAEVNVDDTDVEALTINSACASDRAKREDERVDTITVTEL